MYIELGLIALVLILVFVIGLTNPWLIGSIIALGAIVYLTKIGLIKSSHLKKLMKPKALIIIAVLVLGFFAFEEIKAYASNVTDTISDKAYMNDPDSRLVRLTGEVALYSTGSDRETVNLKSIEVDSQNPNLASILNPLAIVDYGKVDLQYREYGEDDWSNFENTCSIDLQGLESDDGIAENVRTFVCSGLKLKTGEYYVRLKGFAQIDYSFWSFPDDLDIQSNELYIQVE